MYVHNIMGRVLEILCFESAVCVHTLVYTGNFVWEHFYYDYYYCYFFFPLAKMSTSKHDPDIREMRRINDAVTAVRDCRVELL